MAPNKRVQADRHDTRRSTAPCTKRTQFRPDPSPTPGPNEPIFPGPTNADSPPPPAPHFPTRKYKDST